MIIANPIYDVVFSSCFKTLRLRWSCCQRSWESFFFCQKKKKKGFILKPDSAVSRIQRNKSMRCNLQM